METCKKIYLSLSLTLAGIAMFSCNKSFLDYTPQGSLSEEVLATKKGVDGLLIGAYAALDGQGQWGLSISGGTAWATPPDNWMYGSGRGGEALASIFAIDPSNSFLDDKWRADYEGVSRCNSVIKVAAKAKDIPEADMKNMLGQARFLRGHYYFDLKKMFNMVPWIDETTTDSKQPNDKDIWPNIVADFKFGYDNMNESQSEAGRANKWAAAAYLGKAYLYQHRYDSAKFYFDEVIANGQTANGIHFDLNNQFADNFKPEKELANPEAVFAIDMSANTGNGTIATANQGDMLNYPINSPFGCCGNFQPGIDLVNSFRTNPATGLPYLDDYNDHPIKSDLGIAFDQPFTPDNGTIDPRLDWSAGRRGIPYMDWGLMPGSKWMWNQLSTGPYVNKKRVYWQATEKAYHDPNSWAPGSAVNYNVIQFSDVLLMAAEAEAQLGNYDQAEAYVNRVRNRAARPEGWVYQYVDDSDPMGGFSATPAADYFVKPYPDGEFAANGKDYALKAIYFERKLELAMEGHRFFDLVRWGLAAQFLNSYYAYESALVTEPVGMSFIAGKHEYYPIPQVEIDISTVGGKATLMQNPNY